MGEAKMSRRARRRTPGWAVSAVRMAMAVASLLAWVAASGAGTHWH